MKDEFDENFISNLAELVLESDIERVTRTDPLVAGLLQALAEESTKLKERVDLLTQFSPLHNEDYD